jgi:hypothetical protein
MKLNLEQSVGTNYRVTYSSMNTTVNAQIQDYSSNGVF